MKERYRLPGEEKLLVIGLDGAGHSFLRQMLEAGHNSTSEGLLLSPDYSAARNLSQLAFSPSLVQG